MTEQVEHVPQESIIPGRYVCAAEQTPWPCETQLQAWAKTNGAVFRAGGDRRAHLTPTEGNDTAAYGLCGVPLAPGDSAYLDSCTDCEYVDQEVAALIEHSARNA